ncbi:MAG: ABC transporter substrate-binding protein [Anaerotignaceae bacterium]
MKKLICFILTTVVMFSMLAGCAKTEPPVVQEEVTQQEETTTEDTKERALIKVGLLNGPTAMGAVMLMNEVDNGFVFGNYNFEVFTSPDDVVSRMVSGELDAATVPVNLASTLYNKTNGEIVVAAINTLGTLYLLENGNTVNSVADLSGKTIYSSGQGSVPQYVMEFLLAQAGVTDCTIEYMQTHAELSAALSNGTAQIAVIPEPFASVAMSKDSNIRVALDIAEAWDQYSYEEENVPNTLTMGCLVVRKSFLETNQADFNKFMDEYDNFLEEVTDSPEEAAQLIVDYGILTDVEIAKTAIPRCNIKFIEGSKMSRLVDNFLTTIGEMNPQAIGGEIPGEEFYYLRFY